MEKNSYPGLVSGSRNKFGMTRLFILLILFLLTLNPAKANFGESCSILPISTSDSYLMSSTAYGHIVGNIDMTTHVKGACEKKGTDFNFCLKLPDGAGQPCTPPITLRLGESRTLASMSNSPELGGSPILGSIILTVRRIENKICLTMPTSRGPIPVACRDSSEATLPPEEKIPECKVLGNSCYDGHIRSQSLFNFSGVAVHCLRETLDKVLFGEMGCIPDDNVYVSNLVPFADFQETLKLAVKAALILYVIFFGFKLILKGGEINLETLATFVLKFILVAYFSTGLGPTFLQDNKARTHNGMTEYVLPILSQVTSDFAAIVFNSSGTKGLCDFDARRYRRGYEFFGIWDSIDCRLGYYLGMNLMYNSAPIIKEEGKGSSPYGVSLNLGSPGKEGIDALKIMGGMPFFSIMFGYLMSGNIIIFIAGLIFAIIFISIVLQFFTSYLVCFVTLYVMTYIAPIFVPMALFERTKGYFDAWVKVLVSCALQPAIIAGFIAFMVTTYDTAIYKNCEFKRHDYTAYNVNFSTFEIQLPKGDPEECKNSFGYKLLKNYIGQGWEKHVLILFPIYSIRDTLGLLPDFLYMAVFTVLFYFFSQSISQFASDITSGPIMDSVTASPTKVIDGAMKAAKFAKDAIATYQGQGKGMDPKEEQGGVSRRGAGGGQEGGGGGGEGSSSAADKISGGT